MEMTFGVPRMRRTIRWYTAFNEFMAARVDMMQAAAAFIMKKTVKGATTSAQIEKLASKAIRASSDLRTVAETAIDPAVKLGPRPAAIAGSTENLEASAKDWLAWAAGHDIHPWVLDHLTDRPDHLWSRPPKTEEPFSTPRSWHMLSDALRSFGRALDEFLHM